MKELYVKTHFCEGGTENYKEKINVPVFIVQIHAGETSYFFAIFVHDRPSVNNLFISITCSFFRRLAHAFSPPRPV